MAEEKKVLDKIGLTAFAEKIKAWVREYINSLTVDNGEY